MNIDEKISFIVRFAQLDISQFRSSELKHLRDQFSEYFYRHQEDSSSPARFGFFPIIMKQPLPQEFTKEQFMSLQKETLLLLQGGAGQILLSMSVFTLASPMQSRIPRSLLAHGAARDLFLLTCALLVVRPEIAGRLRRCPAPQVRFPGQTCNKLFLRIRKQQYCSKTCANRVSKQKERREPNLPVVKTRGTSLRKGENP